MRIYLLAMFIFSLIGAAAAANVSPELGLAGMIGAGVVGAALGALGVKLFHGGGRR